MTDKKPRRAFDTAFKLQVVKMIRVWWFNLKRHNDVVVCYLSPGLSPQQVSMRLWLEKKLSISAECIYLRLYKDKAAGGALVRHLRCQKPRKKRYGSGHERRGTLKRCVRISERAKVVEERSRIAGWEGDTVIGRGHQAVAGDAGRAHVTLYAGSALAPAYQR